MKFENKGSGPKGGVYLVCEAAQRQLGCYSVRWRYRDFEASFLAFVRELNIEEIASAQDGNTERVRLEDQIAALRGEEASLHDQMEKAYELYAAGGGAVSFVAAKLADLEERKVALQSKVKTLENERQALAAVSAAANESQTQIRSLIKRLQTPEGDETYRLRAQINATLKHLVADLFVATVGNAPSVERTISALQEEADDGWSDVVEHLRRSLDDKANRSRYFCVGFRDGTVRAVYPDDENPLRYRQQILSSQSELIRMVPGRTVNLFGDERQESGRSKAPSRFTG